MQISVQPKVQPLKEIVLRFFFQVLPTVAVALYLLWMANLQLSLLRGQHIPQVIAFGIGITLSMMLYQTRIRFVPTFIAMIILGWLIAQALGYFAVGDVEPFFLIHQFYVYFFVYAIGWVVGYGMQRIRFAPVLVAVFSVGSGLYLASMVHTNPEQVDFIVLLLFLIPVAVYGVYIIFISEQLRDYRISGQVSIWKLVFRIIIFNSLSAVCACIVLLIFSADIRETLDKIQKGTYREQYSMLQKSDDGSSIKSTSSMSGSNNRSKELLMLAYIDNFFDGTSVPNPLYMVTFYYAQFDTATETFIETNDMPDRDLYRPDVSQVPLYHSAYDSGVLAFGKDNQLTRTVEIEVYNKGLTASTFVAPSTAFFVQPIAVERSFQSEYKSAYRAKSVISDLNSAYFIYNVNNPEVQKFQETRMRILQNVKDFSLMDSAAFAYYTAMPDIEMLRPVKALAAKIAAGKNTPIEKIVAVRDYFLSKDANGKPLFKYTDNPGVPDIPSASKLHYFLFQNRKGYCAHYAGATLFLLRSLGIPSRITAGFLTEDRSTSNPGWYYFYADQVHAWVQVYFPGYGWLDFDTTVGNEEARESEQTDGTPPLQPTKASLAINGYILAVDTAKKEIEIAGQSAMALDKNYTSHQQAEKIKLDISIARILKDTGNLSVGSLLVGDSITAITYGRDVLQHTPIDLSMHSLAQKLPVPVPVDHIQVRRMSHKAAHPDIAQAPEKPGKWKWMISLVAVLTICFLLIQLLPKFIKWYYEKQGRSSNFRKAAYYQYVLALYYLWMMRIRKKSHETSLQFSERIDGKYQTNFGSFMQSYLKLKYSNHEFTKNEEVEMRGFASLFIEKISGRINSGERNRRWFNVKNALQFAWLKKEL